MATRRLFPSRSRVAGPAVGRFLRVPRPRVVSEETPPEAASESGACPSARDRVLQASPRVARPYAQPERGWPRGPLISASVRPVSPPPSVTRPPLPVAPFVTGWPTGRVRVCAWAPRAVALTLVSVFTPGTCRFDHESRAALSPSSRLSWLFGASVSVSTFGLFVLVLGRARPGFRQGPPGPCGPLRVGPCGRPSRVGSPRPRARRRSRSLVSPQLLSPRPRHFPSSGL